MNQKTHSWIAIRAVALLEDIGQEANLVTLLKLHVRKASVGAWIPDQIDAKRGSAGSATENHVFKMNPYINDDKARFITDKQELIEHTGLHRRVARFLDQDTYLDTGWWSQPYRGEVSKPGQHLPNRSMALATMMRDLLLLGDRRIDTLIPGDIRFAEYMASDTRTKEAAAVMYFFMLSHFIADASMPCHCDARKLSLYDNGLHKELEEHWADQIDPFFEKRNLIKRNRDLRVSQSVSDSNQILQKARQVDGEFYLNFSEISIPDLRPKHDVWLELIYLCRASFAVASIIAPHKQYQYGDDQARAPFTAILGNANPDLLKTIDQLCMYDATLNTTIMWKHIWKKVSKE